MQLLTAVMAGVGVGGGVVVWSLNSYLHGMDESQGLSGKSQTRKTTLCMT
jgi:hypothetical protein